MIWRMIIIKNVGFFRIFLKLLIFAVHNRMFQKQPKKNIGNNTVTNQCIDECVFVKCTQMEAKKGR